MRFHAFPAHFETCPSVFGELSSSARVLPSARDIKNSACLCLSASALLFTRESAANLTLIWSTWRAASGWHPEAQQHPDGIQRHSNTQMASRGTATPRWHPGPREWARYLVWVFHIVEMGISCKYSPGHWISDLFRTSSLESEETASKGPAHSSHSSALAASAYLGVRILSASTAGTRRGYFKCWAMQSASHLMTSTRVS